MKISEKRKSALYSAINDPVMDLRIKQQRDRPMNAGVEWWDDELFKLHMEIWNRVKAVLDIEAQQ